MHLGKKTFEQLVEEQLKEEKVFIFFLLSILTKLTYRFVVIIYIRLFFPMKKFTQSRMTHVIFIFWKVFFVHVNFCDEAW